MGREGWDLTGRAAIRLDGLMLGTSDRELFNVPVSQLPASCAWAVTFPLGAWAGDLESAPLGARSLDAALDEVEALYPLASWWWAVRGEIAPVVEALIGGDSPDAGAVESDLWWLLGQVPIKVIQWRDGVRVDPHQDVVHTVIGEAGHKLRIRSMAHGSTIEVKLRASWQFCGYGALKTRWSGDFDALMARLRLHPGLKVEL